MENTDDIHSTACNISATNIYLHKRTAMPHAFTLKFQLLFSAQHHRKNVDSSERIFEEHTGGLVTAGCSTATSSFWHSIVLVLCSILPIFSPHLHVFSYLIRYLH